MEDIPHESRQVATMKTKEEFCVFFSKEYFSLQLPKPNALIIDLDLYSILAIDMDMESFIINSCKFSHYI